MTNNNEALLQLQIGKETTIGTGVTPTAILMGVTDPEITADNKTTILGKQKRGTYYPGHAAVLNAVKGKGKFGMDASYEDACYLLEGMTGVATPSGGGPYVRTGAAPASTSPTPRMNSYVLGAKGASTAMKLISGIHDTLTIKGNAAEGVMIDSELIGQKMIETAGLTSLSQRDVNWVLAHQGAISVDAWGGTIGATVYDDAFWSFEMQINAHRMLTQKIGNLSPTQLEEGQWDGTLKLVWEFNADSQALAKAIAEQTDTVGRQVRFLFTSGTNIFQVDFAGVFTKGIPAFEMNDGLVSYALEMEGLYNPTLGNWFQWSITNDVATLA